MDQPRHDEVRGAVSVRLWAAARAALGATEVTLEVPGPVTVAWVREELVRRHPDRDRLPSVLGICSVLVGDRPLGKADPATVPVSPGETVEFLPPFAGG
jgi:molybdopterin converting factor small subunit